MSTSRLPSILMSPASQAIYSRLTSVLSKLGPFVCDEKKSSLHLVNGRAFAGVHPRVYGMILNLVLDSPIKDARVHKCERVSANRYHVEFKLTDPTDLDSMLVSWLKKAYALTK